MMALKNQFQALIATPMPPSGNDANTVLLLHCDGTNGATSFPDASPWGTPNTIVAGTGATVSTAQSQFGGASFGSTGAAGARLTVTPAANFNFGSADFTIDFWLRLGGTPSGNFYLVSKPPVAGGTYNSFVIYLPGASPTCYFGSSGTSWDIGNIAGAALSLNAWHHLAIVRSGTSIKFYIDGVSQGTPITSSAALASNANALLIGGANDAGGGVAWWIDEFRVSNIARWTANFVPPVVPYS